MRKLIFLIILSIASSNLYSQTKTNNINEPSPKPKFYNLSCSLIISFNNIYCLVNNNNPFNDIGMHLRGQLNNSISSMNFTIQTQKEELIKILGEKDYAELQNQVKNYDDVASKKEALNSNQFQSSILWLKVSQKKVDEIIVNLMK